jgi:hypothetical protein
MVAVQYRRPGAQFEASGRPAAPKLSFLFLKDVVQDDAQFWVLGDLDGFAAIAVLADERRQRQIAF